MGPKFVGWYRKSVLPKLHYYVRKLENFDFSDTSPLIYSHDYVPTGVWPRPDSAFWRGSSIDPCQAVGQGASYSIVVGDGNTLETNQGANGLSATVPVNSTVSGEITSSVKDPNKHRDRPVPPPPDHKAKKPKVSKDEDWKSKAWSVVKKMLPDPDNEVSLLDVDRIGTVSAAGTAVAVQADIPPVLAYEGKFEYPGLTGEEISTIDLLADRYFQLDSFLWLPSAELFKPLEGNTSVDLVDESGHEAVWSLPESALLAAPRQAFTKTFQANAFYRCGWELLMEVNGTMFHQGALALVAIPEGAQRASYANGTGRTLAYPHAILNLRTSNQARLMLPFCSPARFDPTTGPIFLGEQTALGIRSDSYHQQWTLVVWVMSPLVALQGEHALTVNLLFRPLEAQFMGPHYIYGQPFVVRELVGSEGLATTQPGQELNAINWSPAVSDPTWLAGEYKTMSQIARIPSVTQLISWKGGSAAPAGTILARFPVSTSNMVESSTWMSFAMQFYTHWRGTLLFNLTFCGARQQNGKVLVSFLPLSTYSDLDLEQLMSGTYTIWDVGLNSTLSFVVPYCSSTVWKTIGSASSLDLTQNMGMVYVAVYNPLVTPVGTPEAKFFVTWAGGDDFQLRQPSVPRLLKQNDGDQQITNIETKIRTERLPAQIELGNLDQSDLAELAAIYRPFWTGTSFQDSRVAVDSDTSTDMVWYVSLDPTDWSPHSLFSVLVKSFTYVSGNLHVKFTLQSNSSVADFTFAVSYVPPGGLVDASLDQALNMPLVQIDVDGHVIKEVPINIPQSCVTEVIPTSYAGYSELTRSTWGRLTGSGWGTLVVSISPRVPGSKVSGSWWMDARLTQGRFYMPRVTSVVGGQVSERKTPFSLTTRTKLPLWQKSDVKTKTIDFSDAKKSDGQAREGEAPIHEWRECWLWEGVRSFAFSDGAEHIVVSDKVELGDLDGLTKIRQIPLVKFLQLRSYLGVTLVSTRAEFLDMILNIDGCSPQTQTGVLDLPPVGQCTGQGIIENTRIAAESVSYASMNLERALTQERLDKISEISKSFMLASENIHDSVQGVNRALDALTPIITAETSPLIAATEGIAEKLTTWVIRMLGYIVILASNFSMSTVLGVFLTLSAEYLVKVSFDVFKANPFACVYRWICERLGLGMVPIDGDEIAEIVATTVDNQEDPGEGPSGQSFKPRDFNDWANLFKNVDWAASRLIILIERLIKHITEIRNKPEINISWYHDDIINLYSDSIKSLSVEGVDPTQLSINLNEARRLLSLALKANNISYQTLLKQTLTNYTQAQISLTRTVFATRPEPVVLYIYGNPGSGKSVLAGLIARAVSKALTGKADDIYAPSSFGLDHFDGYHQQTVHMIDDLGQAVDGSDWANFCNMVSTAPWAPPMAKLEEKGMYYTSKVVIVTANFNLPNYASAREPKALERRLHFKLFMGGLLNVDFACAPDGKPMRHFKSGCQLLRNTAGNVKDSGSILPCKFKDMDDLVDLILAEVKRRAGNMTLFDELVGQAGAPTDGKPATTSEKKVAIPQRNPADEEPKPAGFFRSVFNTFSVAVGRNPPASSLEEVATLQKRAAWLKAIFAGLGIIATFFGLWHVFRDREDASSTTVEVEEWLEDCKPREVAEAQGPYTSIPHQFRKPPKPASRLKADKAKYQAVPPILRKVQDSVKWTTFFADSVPIGSCSSWNCVDRFFITVHHMFGKCTSFKIGNVMYNKSDIPSVRIGEAEMFILPNVPQGKNLLKYVKARGIGGVRAGFLAGNLDGVPNVVRVWDLACFRGIETQDGIFNENSIGYRCASYAGLCGAPLILEDPADYRIGGIHFAGYSSFSGFAVHLTKQELLNAMAKLTTTQSKIIPMEQLEKPVHVVRKTALKPSPAAGAFEYTMEPAILRQSDSRLKSGLILDETIFEKHGKGDVKEPWKNLVEAFDVYFSKFSNKEIRQLTLRQAINGTPLLDGIDMDQSPGYPYNTQGISRRSLFTWDQEAGEWEPVPELREEVEKVLENPTGYIYTTFLKDELRKSEKVEKGATRVVEAAPLPVILAGRMLLGGLFEEMQSQPGEYGSAVGCDPELDWTKFFWAFEKFENVYDLDYKAFDSTVPTAAFDLLAKHLQELIGDERVGRYIEAIASSKHVYGSQVYLMEGGMPSGCVGTSILNTICNNCFVLSALLEHKDFDIDNYYLIAYGDDVVYATNPSIDPSFIKKFYDTHTPLKVTPANKGEEFNKDSTIFDVTFLKRHFVPDPEKPWLIHPTIDHSVYEQSCMWVRDGEWQDTIDSLCQLAVHSGPTNYKNWVDTVRAKALERGVTPRFYPFSYLHKRWMNKLEA
nr:MAG: polyprotein [Picornaviridae sp.]